MSSKSEKLDPASAEYHTGSLERARSFPFAIDADPTAFVAPGAVVVGEVTLEPHSSVWFGAVLRGDMAPIRLGEESNVQDNSVFHADHHVPATVGRRVVVGHRAIVHGSTVEDRCLIGMGSVLLNRSRIGTGSLVAAGALVGEGKQIPPGSLVVGVPGKVIGEVSDTMREAIDRGADHYVTLAQTYQSRGVGSPVATSGGAGTLGAGWPKPDELQIGTWLRALASSPAEWMSALAGVEEKAMDAAPRGMHESLHDILGRWVWEEESLWGARLDELLDGGVTELTTPGAPEPPPLVEAIQATDTVAKSRHRRLARLHALPREGWSHSALSEDRGTVTIAQHVRDWANRDRGLFRLLIATRDELGEG